MKKTVLLLLSTIYMLAAISQGNTIKGVCVNKNGDPVEYVNIYMPKQFQGIISDGIGAFTINIPDNMQDSVAFSHISFETLAYSLEEFEKKYKSAMESGSGLKIVLQEREFILGTAVVRPDSPKIVNLNSRGTKQPKRYIEFGFKYKGFDNIGQIVKLKKRSSISSLEFTLAKNTMDSLVLRVLLYKVNGKVKAPLTTIIPRDPLPVLTLLTNIPYYIYPDKSEESQMITCDFSDEDIIADGDVYIRLELVQGSKVGMMSFPAYDYSHKYFIDMQTNKWERFQYGMGLQLRGYTIK